LINSPQNLDEEAALLGTLITVPGATKEVADILRPEHFTRDFNAQIYKACSSLYQDNLPINNVSVANRYDEIGGRKFQGQRAVIATLMEASFYTSADIRYYALNLIEHWRRRQAVYIYKKGIDDIQDMSTPAHASIARATEGLFNLHASDTDDDALATLSHEALPEALRRLERARNGEGDGSVAAYPWRSVARLTPLRRGEVTVVCGRPGSGKSSYLLNIILQAAKNGIPSAFFSLEMSKVTLTLRLISHLSGVNSRKIERGETSDEEHALVCKKITELGLLPIYIDDNSDLDEMTFITKARSAKQKYEIGLIVLDYLQLMTRRKDTTDAAAVGSCARTVRKTARMLDIPVIEASQVSRSCEMREDKRPILSDLRESGEVEQEADIVSALYRSDYYQRDISKHTGQTEVIVRKHRNGGLGTNYLLFRPETSQFFDLSWAHE
jgi:replicative DNA helicase